MKSRYAEPFAPLADRHRPRRVAALAKPHGDRAEVVLARRAARLDPLLHRVEPLVGVLAADEVVGDRLRIERVPPAVAAEEERVAVAKRRRRGVRLDVVLDAERGKQLVLLRMRNRLLRAHQTSVDHPLDDAVVGREWLGDPVADAVEPRIADMRPERARALQVDPEDDDRRMHPRSAVHVVLRSGEDVGVRSEHARREGVGVERGAPGAQRRFQRGDRAARRFGPVAVAAGAIGDDRDPAIAVAADAHVVLVALALAELAARGDRNVERDRHGHFGAADAAAFSRRSRSSCCS